MDWISEGVTALISGMSAVFLILILISFIISKLGHLGRLEKKSVQEVQVHAKPVVPAKPLVDEAEEQRRVVAAITVALAQDLRLSPDAFVVRRYRRL